MATLGYLASFLMGITLGLMGGGGSILTVPILVYLFSFTPIVATAYSLLIVGSTALIGSAMYLRKGEVDLRMGLLFALPSVVGVHLSRALIVPHLPDVIGTLNSFVLTKDVFIMATFAILMVAASLSMIMPRKEANRTSSNSSLNFFLIGTQGVLVGLVAGFVGAGGGFLIIPALVVFAGLRMRVAIGTSLSIIAVQSLFGFAGDILRGLNADWIFLGTVALIAALGIFAGSSVASKIKEAKLKIAFGWFVLLMGTAIFIEQIRHV